MDCAQMEEIDGFKIYFNKFVGQGAYAAIYECSNEAINVPLCVKALRLNSKHRELFKREVAILEKIQQFNNKNLITIYHIAQQYNVQYIFMQKYPCNLEQWLMEKKRKNILLSASKILDVIHQLVNGYKKLYDNKIVHRDLKPENILVGDDEQLKISDYGLGKIFEDVQARGNHTMQGTPMYASPQCLIDGNYSAKTDVYSLGMIVYYITFQNHLFNVKSLGDLIKTVKKVLEIQQVVVPPIKNEGTQEQISIIVDFLKLTITYEEEDRIEWEELFKWFLENQNNSHQMSQQFKNQKELLISQQINIRQSLQLKKSNRMEQQSNEQLELREQFIESSRLASEVQNNFQQIQESGLSRANATQVSNHSKKSQDNLNQIRAVNLMSSQFAEQNQSDKLHQVKSSSSTEKDRNNFNPQQVQNQSLQYSQESEISNQKLSILSNLVVEDSQIFNPQSSIAEQFDQKNHTQDNIQSQLEQLVKSSSPSEHVNFDSGYLQDQFLQVQKSLNDFRNLPQQSSIFKSQSQYVQQQPQGKLRLRKKTENKLFRLLEILLAKVELTELTSQSLQLISFRAELQKFTFQSTILQVLLVGYKFSLLLNGFQLCNPARDSQIGSKISYQILPKQIDEYLNCQTQDVQNQKQTLQEQYQNTLENVQILLKQFYSEDLQKLNKTIPIISIFRLFNEPVSLFNYNLFLDHFNQHFRDFANNINKTIEIETNRDCLKFMAYSLKFSTQDEEYPLKNFEQLDKESIPFITDDINSLYEFIWLNLPNLI